jgi:uncharacterized protein
LALAACCLVSICFVLSVAHAEPDYPALTGRVVDGAGILTEETKAQLTASLAAEEKRSGTQIVVVTLKSLEGTPIETFGYKLGRRWGIGQKGRNNGALFLIAPNEHRMRIEVGYGLEGKLTDLACAVIIHDIVTPKFKDGDFDRGVLDGTNAILKVVGGGSVTDVRESFGEEAESFSLGAFLLILCFIVFICWPAVIIFWFYTHVKEMHGLHGKTAQAGGRSSESHSSFWDSDHDSSSSSSSSDDFSGGGGDFGGGGASGSW